MSRKIEIDTRTFVRFWLVILALFILVVMVMQASTALLIIGIALFLAIALQPLARQLDKIDKHKERRGASQVSALVLVMVVLTLVVAFVAPVVINETGRFLSTMPDTVSEALNSSSIDRLGEMIGIHDVSAQITDGVRDFANSILTNFGSLAMTSVGAIGSFLTGLVLVIVLTILFMLEGPAILDKGWAAMAGKNDKAAKVIRRMMSRMADVIGRYVWGQMVVAIIDGIVVGMVVFLISIIFGFSAGLAVPMGLISMVLYLIPMFGPIVSCILISLLLFFNAPFAGVIYAVFYIVYAQVENNVIGPRIQGKGMNLPPLIVLIAVTIGMYMFGLVGVLIAIPIAGCIKVFVQEYPSLKALREKE